MLSDTKLRENILNLLGNECKECGEKDPRVLHIDHINGGGTKERSKFKSHRSYAFSVYRKIKLGSREYQILCANCNSRKEYIKRKISKED